MTKIPLEPFYFIRHGETEWNRKRIYMGQQDIPLNEKGKAQAIIASQYFRSSPIEHIVTSSLIRAYETAQIINMKLKLPLTVLEELKECNLGNAEGKNHNDEAFMQKWLKGEHPKGGESRLEFERRVIIGINKAIKLRKNVLIVSHGGVYAGLSRVMGWPDIHLNNCAPIFHNPPKQLTHPWTLSPLAEDMDHFSY